MEERVAALARECCNDVHGAAYDLSTLSCLLPTAPPAKPSLTQQAYTPPPPLKAHQPCVAFSQTIEVLPPCRYRVRCSHVRCRLPASKGWSRRPEQRYLELAPADACTRGSLDATSSLDSSTGTEWAGGAERLARLREQQGRMAESRAGEHGRGTVLLRNVSLSTKRVRTAAL
jgi:hypothetical protein